MAILNRSITAEDAKNRWATQWGCFLDAQHLYGRKFAVDVAAEPETAKVKRFFASVEWFESRRLSAFGIGGGDGFGLQRGQKILGFDSLRHKWPADWWCNPPFSHKWEFVKHARRQQAAGRPGMMLLPYSPVSTSWRRELGSDVIIYEPDGRYNFLEPDGVTGQSGANFESVFVLFGTQLIREAPRITFNRGIHATTNHRELARTDGAGN